jgi:hypothetical protein
MPQGARECGNGTYADAGDTCCPGGVSCSAGNVCTSGGGCMPQGSVDCGDGRYCSAGTICGTGDSCLTPGQSNSSPDLEEFTQQALDLLEQFGRMGGGSGSNDPSPAPTPPPAERSGSNQASCSGITRSDGPDIRPENCPTSSGENVRMPVPRPAPSPAPRPSPLAPSPEVVDAWSTQGAYNHSLLPFVLQLFDGTELVVPPKHTVWSVQDDSRPNGRRLEVRPWREGDTGGTGANCAQEYLTARSKDFIVSLKCELGRQDNLVKDAATRKYEFEHREDGYISDDNKCRAIGGIPEDVEGVAEKSAEYWRQNPKEPARRCRVTRDNHTDYRPMREKNWHTAQECADNLLSSFGLVPELPVTTNKRGVSGCRFVQQ